MHASFKYYIFDVVIFLDFVYFFKIIIKIWDYFLKLLYFNITPTPTIDYVNT